jgi:UDP-2-acetamido-3-amino-2,3-dideoxy-glucuronate N-acetyltransferase
MKPYYFKLEKFGDFSGYLNPFYVNKSFPKKFKLKRFFFIFGKKKYFRADHAHKKCDQIIIPVKGKIKITLMNKEKKIYYISQKLMRGLYVPKKNWIKINFYKDFDCLLVLCNYKYDKKEYISSYNDFIKRY